MENIPKGYKKSKVGIIPKEWEVVRLGELGKIIGGGTPNTKKLEYWGNDIYWFTPTEIKNKYIYESKRKISKLGLQKSSAKILPKNTLLLTTRATIGNVGIAKQECSTNQGFQSIIVNKKNSYEYVYYWLLQNKKEFLKRANGSTFIEISKKDIAKVLFLRPYLKEQQKIAKILTTWDKAIEKQEELIKAKERLKKGLMQKLLSGKVRFKEFKEEWKEVRLDKLFTFKKGQGISKNQLIESGINKCILYGELYTTYTEVIDNVRSRTNYNEGIKSVKDDILIPSSTTTSAIDLAIASVVKFNNILLGGDINILRKKNNNINGEFVSKYLTHIKKLELAKYAQGITIIHLYSKDIKHIKIHLPPLPEQQKITQVLTIADKEIELLKKELEALKKQKKGLMQKLLTGEIRVKT